MAKQKEKYNSPQWDIVTAKVICNTSDTLGILFYGNIPPKKNSRINFRGLSLPSANYTEWHKRCKQGIGNIDFKFTEFPCSLNIYSIIHNNVKKDLDNYTQSIQDFLTDIGAIPDDNNMVMSEIHTQVVARIKNCPLTYIVIRPLKYNIIEKEDDLKYNIELMDKEAEVLYNY